MDKSSSESGKVLILTTAYSPLIGGSEIAIGEVIQRLKGFSFDILTPRYNVNYPKQESMGENIEIFRVGPAGILGKFLFPITGYIKADRLMKSGKYDLVHLWQASHAGGTAWNLKKWSAKNIPLLITLQEGKNLSTQNIFVKFFRKVILRSADGITAISSYLADYARSIAPDINVTIIPNGVDTELFGKNYSDTELEELKQNLKLPSDKKILITVSRLVHKNAVDDIVRAMRLPRLINTILVVVGEGEERKNIEKLADDTGVKDRIFFTGSVEHKNLPKYMKLSDIFIRPSRSEGLGIAFLEAMASGLPVVGTSVGGIKDFLRDEKTGMICRPDDPESIAQSAGRILENEDLKKKITENGKKLVFDMYDWNNVARQYAGVYSDIMGQENIS